MDVIYGLIPGMLLLGLAAVAVLFWAARSGQFDDLEGDARRILLDEDEDEVDPRRVPDAEPDQDSTPDRDASSWR
ncbi:cytochrome oxidase maturation protein, cbb3-type [Thiorhodococcus drewsii AZ1]|uniref:Cytochrome oxidase maturation protein, cbb3-type n=1 Tax=Thiorhodococcus drewsii AZ1 TaxID=765913 RepID=G2E303_9GAMM|nr:cbb3-type cytochrome oxidase assembly protein CcoS [Thiorhodococcus drewsii]EGV30465.1 cytochrome oxidase maturation protein, cbb3-type [Thiorhodococcus drewsii AZ1]